jgi:tetratricopeptide (TPR) repeat protein
MSIAPIPEGGVLAARQLSTEEAAKRERLLAAGNQAFDDEDYARALDCYHRASVLDGSDARVWGMIGLAYANLELHREAWRSFKLALVCDPEEMDTQWYAAEFLYNIEDFFLARLLLERYVTRETDAERLAEAEEMLADVRRLATDDDELRERPRFTGSDDPDDAGEEEELAGFDIEDEVEIPADDADPDYDELEDGEFGEETDEQFTASLQLELTGMASRCLKCAAALPLDAPYCYNCLAPHLYEEE